MTSFISSSWSNPNPGTAIPPAGSNAIRLFSGCLWRGLWYVTMPLEASIVWPQRAVPGLTGAPAMYRLPSMYATTWPPSTRTALKGRSGDLTRVGTHHSSGLGRDHKLGRPLARRHDPAEVPLVRHRIVGALMHDGHQHTRGDQARRGPHDLLSEWQPMARGQQHQIVVHRI